MATKTWTNGHPRGMAGKKHTDETKQKLSEAYRAAWGRPDSKLNSDENRQRISDRNTRLHGDGTFYNKTENAYSRCTHGWWEGGGKRYFMRSKWEMNYAAYLEWLKAKNQIVDWEYEPQTFWFEAVRRGVRSYKPDFRVYLNGGQIEYHEVKGWMDAKSQTKLKRMKKYYPLIKVILIDDDSYKAVKKWSRLIPGWLD
jgi:hypothetical protein